MATKPDLSEFYKLSKPKRRPCQVGSILSGEVTPELSPKERGQLIAALETDAGIITASAIVAWLKQRGYESNINRISNHRRGTCNCDG